MYQNYMKRGLSIMLLFALFMGLSMILSTEIFVLPLPIIFAYSFFDTYNIRNKKDEDDEPKDVYIWEVFDFGNTLSKFNINKRNGILGVILVFFGIYLILTNIFNEIAYVYDIEELEIFTSILTHYLPILIISLLSIYIGSKMLTNNKKDE